jgi:hypothetical protein
MDAQIFLDNFGTIAEAPGGVQRLRELVLDLAVQGRLVPQDPTESRAPTDLQAALAAKAAATEGLRKQPSLSPPRRLQASLPSGWIWARTDDVFLVTGGIQKSSKRRPHKNHYPYLRVANVQRGRLDLREIERFELFDGELDRLRLEPGDLLVVEGNGSEAEIGRCARWDGEIDNCVHQNHLIRCRPMQPGLEHYLLLFLNSPAGKSTMRNLAVTTSGLYNLSVAKIRAITFPMPPRGEQRRIRFAVIELMELCDDLEARKEHRRRVTTRFRGSALHALTEAETPDDLHRAWKRVSTNWPILTGHPDSLTDLRQTILQLAVEGRLTSQDPNEEPASVILQDCQDRKRFLVQAGAVRGRRPSLPELSADNLPYPLPSGWQLAQLILSPPGTDRTEDRRSWGA